ncbi:hypothetical protein D9619_006082 [Psilocybe cf. subviscida]|uniref:Uncharacterized protein n=1 Tax=Psilocybe cf. subviscida TaxID=2480587 RepID=A0A8H5B3U0_9AGAR|nr:hypothetical protein D9619_006082 [Psilocybe cf. subviscida]
MTIGGGAAFCSNSCTAVAAARPATPSSSRIRRFQGMAPQSSDSFITGASASEDIRGSASDGFPSRPSPTASWAMPALCCSNRRHADAFDAGAPTPSSAPRSQAFFLARPPRVSSNAGAPSSRRTTVSGSGVHCLRTPSSSASSSASTSLPLQRRRRQHPDLEPAALRVALNGDWFRCLRKKLRRLSLRCSSPPPTVAARPSLFQSFQSTVPARWPSASLGFEKRRKFRSITL